MNDEIKIIKFIAPKVMSVNGRQSPCECSDKITCAYCVQASLLAFDKKMQDDTADRKRIMTRIREYGIRRLARELNVRHRAVQHWLASGSFPSHV